MHCVAQLSHCTLTFSTSWQSTMEISSTSSTSVLLQLSRNLSHFHRLSASCTRCWVRFKIPAQLCSVMPPMFTAAVPASRRASTKRQAQNKRHAQGGSPTPRSATLSFSVTSRTVCPPPTLREHSICQQSSCTHTSSFTKCSRCGKLFAAGGPAAILHAELHAELECSRQGQTCQHRSRLMLLHPI